MKTYYGLTANQVWYDAIQDLIAEGNHQEGRDQETIENLHVVMEITDPRQRHIYSRPISIAFNYVEIFWILAGRDDVEFLVNWNPRMKNYSDDGIRYHAAYGYRLRKHFGIDQLKCAYESLKNVSHSRQIVLEIWDTVSDLPEDGMPRSKDIPCNDLAMLKVREGKLYWSQHIRSNDAIWGTPTNFEQWMTLQEVMAGWLDLEVGPYVHWADSFHVYKRHWEELESIHSMNRAFAVGDMRLSYDMSDKVVSHCNHMIHELANVKTCDEAYIIDEEGTEKLLSYANDQKSYENLHTYADMMTVIAAERIRRLGKSYDAVDYVRINCGEDSCNYELFGNWANSKMK